MDPFECLPEEPSAELVPRSPDKMTPRARAEAFLDAQTDEIYRESLAIIDDALRFADVEPEELAPGEKPPGQWVNELGEEGAKRRMRVARYAAMPKKDAPLGITVAMNNVAAISAARARSNQGPKTLNVQFVQLSAPLPAFEVVEVDK